MGENTMFLRLEGPLQAWGGHESKFVVRRTCEAPTKSGVSGIICAALGVPRAEASSFWLPKLRSLLMGVRIDRAGIRWWDYHTVGAEMQMSIAEAEGKTKKGALLTRREYLCDASFLVALQGDSAVIDQIETAVINPKWTLYLGRKNCVPSRPLSERPPESHPDLISALSSVPWRRRNKEDEAPQSIDCLIDWTPTQEQPEAPDDALVWHDVPILFEPPSHQPRFVMLKNLSVGTEGDVRIAEDAAQSRVPDPPRSRADYSNSAYKNARAERLNSDHGLCVFCKSPATTVQHVTYRRAGGNESQEDLRSLCRLCHDAVTMIEYGHGMGLDRINPEHPQWRDEIIKKREEVVRYRSLETRRRRLSAEEVE